jgi:hypothetical protein
MARIAKSGGRLKTEADAHEYIFENLCPHSASESGRLSGEKESGKGIRYAQVNTRGARAPHTHKDYKDEVRARDRHTATPVYVLQASLA